MATNAERRKRCVKDIRRGHTDAERYIELLEMKLFAYRGAALVGIEHLTSRYRRIAPRVEGLIKQLHAIYTAETCEEAHRQVMGGSEPHTALWREDGSPVYKVMKLTDEQKQERVRETEV